jgi:hypothetical protein
MEIGSVLLHLPDSLFSARKTGEKKRTRAGRAFPEILYLAVDTGWMTGVIFPITTNDWFHHTSAVSES